MQIKDENGKVIADINLEDGCSVADLIKSLTNKKAKSSFNNLLKIEESENKKQILFKFSDGEIYYDLPSKFFVKSNGVKISDYAFSRIALKISSKLVIKNHYERNTFWLELKKKTDVPWIKTFFDFVDIWVNKKHNVGWLNSKERDGLCKLKTLNSDKKFFDSIESFSKIPQIQNFEEESLIDFYKGVLVNCESADSSKGKFYLKFSKTKLDNWFLNNLDEKLSGNYFEDQLLSSHVGGYLNCIKCGLREQFKYVFEKYGGVITSSQTKMIKNLIDFGYNPNRLMDYLYRDIYNQGLSLEFENKWSADLGALTLLHDYAKMNVDMKSDYDKYPRYLSTLHDITQNNYRVKESEILNRKFEEVVNQMKKNKMNFSDENYVVVIPNNAKDLIDEGQKLSHCVASYYKAMANNETNIVFVRNKENVNQSLVTIEIKNNKIVQAKGKNNSAPKDKEKYFIDKYEKYLNNICS